MTQETTTTTVETTQESHAPKSLLGPLLVWAVVFADIGTSIYYVPGILYNTHSIGNLAGFFVCGTMSVFTLLTIKYAEVTHRFPQGGGVVSVAGSINRWLGAVGGMFILVDYFLTASISSLSGVQYLTIVFPGLDFWIIGSIHIGQLLITIIGLVFLGALNWIGITESAKVSLVAGFLSFIGDIAVLFEVIRNIGIRGIIHVFLTVFDANSIKATSPLFVLIGFAGSFLAFSGLESITQIAPEMKLPRKKVAAIALLFVVLTIGVTSPLLTIFSTVLQPHAASDEILSTRLISSLGGLWGDKFLEVAVAITAGLLLLFASNTAIIGSYHVEMALGRMNFLPEWVLKHNRVRNTPHNAILVATAIPVIILILVLGNIGVLGDMYAFGLLGAFTLTCAAIDVIRSRDWRQIKGKVSTWFIINFFLGILTTGLVVIAWGTNLLTKPLATIFGGTLSIFGMYLAYKTYQRKFRNGLTLPRVATSFDLRLKGGVLADLTNPKTREHVIHSAIRIAHDKSLPVIFFYMSEEAKYQPGFMEIYDPFYENTDAQRAFALAEWLATKLDIDRHFVYEVTQNYSKAIMGFWRGMKPDLLITCSDMSKCLNNGTYPDRIYHPIHFQERKSVHVVKKW